MKHHHGSRRRRVSVHGFLLICAIFSGLGLLILTWRSIDLTIGSSFPFDVSRKLHKHQDQSFDTHLESSNSSSSSSSVSLESTTVNRGGSVSCATVEEMGEEFAKDELGEGNRMLRRKIQRHFALNGAPRVRELPPEQFCRHGFVLGKSAEAGFGNEMYKILSGAALSIMLNRSLIIGQTRGRFPFGEYISYTNLAFTLKEVKHLWRQNDCLGKYGKLLIMRTDDFEKPAETNVLCSNWKEWTQPIIWFQGTNDGAAIQFFLKNVHLEMRNAASGLFGQPEFLSFRPNVFGELMRVIISPSKDVEEAVNWTLNGQDPDITLHTRMLMNRSVRAIRAALNCLKKAVRSYRHKMRRPRIVLVSDTPSFVKDLAPELEEFAEVLHFDYKLFSGNISSVTSKAAHQLEFRVKDWGPAPRWVAFVDFFLASRAKHAVVSGAHRRVGTTYAQLIAALAAANHLRRYTFPPSYMTHRLQDTETVNPFSAGERKTSKFSFFSSFQSNLLSDGLGNQIGWGHVWNRFAGPLSCHNQPNQCAATPLLPPAWWDGTWQSPIPRDIRRLATFGVQLSSFGQVNESHLRSFCSNRKTVVKTARVFQKCQDGNC